MTVIEIMAQAALYTGTAGLLVKGIVDALKKAATLPSWAAPALALVLGPLIVALFMVAQGDAWTPARVALCIIAGLLAGLSAIGITELHKAARQP